jgi:hypothetical protein
MEKRLTHVYEDSGLGKRAIQDSGNAIRQSGLTLEVIDGFSYGAFADTAIAKAKSGDLYKKLTDFSKYLK